MPDKSALSDLIKAARGEIPADLLIKNCQVVNVFNGLIESYDVAVYDGVIVGFGGQRANRTMDLEGRYLIPGMIDGHIHIESSMVIPYEFARAVVAHGTSAVVADPHEIANVMGVDGIKYLLEATGDLPVDFYFMIPSCVPATHLETAGARMGAAEMKELLQEDRVLGLAEMMNYPGVIHGNPEVLAKLELFKDKIIDGHAPLLSGNELDAYLVAGICSDHECVEAYEAEEKLSKGMWVMIREGSQSRNLAALAPVVNRVTSGRCMLVSDDRHPDDLLAHGHLDVIVNRAVEEGIDPVTAIRMVTINPSRYFGLRRKGAIAPGYQADFFSCASLRDIRPEKVFKGGRLVAEDGIVFPFPRPETGSFDLFSMNLSRVAPENFVLPAGGKKIRVILVFENQILTKELIEGAPVKNALVVADPARDILKIAVIERHKNTGNMGLGFVKGFGMKRGAIASSVAHDSHNIIVVGCDEASMATAVNSLVEAGGGLSVVQNSTVLARLPLPVAGLLSDAPLEDVVGGVEELNHAYFELGGTLPNPFMALSFLALPVIPELRITDRGLVDVRKFDFVSVFA